MDFQLLLTFQRLCQPWASFPGWQVPESDGGCLLQRSHTLLLTIPTPTSYYLTLGQFPLHVLPAWHLLMYGRESTITYSFYGWFQDKTYLKGDGIARIRAELLNSFGKIRFCTRFGFEFDGSIKKFWIAHKQKANIRIWCLCFYQKDPHDFIIIDYPKAGELIYHSRGKKIHFLWQLLVYRLFYCFLG